MPVSGCLVLTSGGVMGCWVTCVPGGGKGAEVIPELSFTIHELDATMLAAEPSSLGHCHSPLIGSKVK